MLELLKVKDLIVHYFTEYGIVEAIDRCGLTVNRGEVIGLVGESGCGKTTTARAILGIIPSPPGKIIKGEILFRGKDLLKMDKKRFNTLICGKAITIIPQDPFNALNPLFTIGTQMRDITRWKSRSQGNGQGTHMDSKKKRKMYRNRIIHMLKEMQIPSPERQLNKYPHEFSGGQRQRIMIAMALLPQPSLIIADEPTTALDVTIEAQILQLLRQLVKDYGVSILYITHDLGVASQVCDRVAIMYAGQIVETSSVASFFAEPLHPYTKMLLNSLPKPEGEITDIPGEVPHLIKPLPGCRFYTRCEFVTDRCKQESPILEEVLQDHWVSCYKPLSPSTNSALRLKEA